MLLISLSKMYFRKYRGFYECHCRAVGYVFREQATWVDCVPNVMAHAQKPDIVFRRNGRVHWNRRGRQFSRLPAVEVCASALVMLDTPCSEVVWRILATHSTRQFLLHFPSRASPSAITFQLDSTAAEGWHRALNTGRFNWVGCYSTNTVNIIEDGVI